MTSQHNPPTIPHGHRSIPAFPLDAEIAALCDSAQLWLMMAATIAWQMGTTLPLGIVAICRTEAKREADEKAKRERPAHVYHNPRQDMRSIAKGKCRCGRLGHWVTGAGEYLCTRHEDDY